MSAAAAPEGADALLAALSAAIRTFILGHVDDKTNHIRKRDAATRSVCSALEGVFTHGVRTHGGALHFLKLKRGAGEAEEAAELVWAMLSDHLLTPDARATIAGEIRSRRERVGRGTSRW